MSSPRLIVIGGFLGAGKTTSLLALAKSYHDEGRRVALITNDQAANLVDTGIVRVRGFRVEEVAGACFCCKFDELAEAANRLREEEKPDVLLAEPVGSCTDLMATVIAPLRALYGDRFSVAPYSVLLDPTRARQMILQKGFGGFSSKVAYIFVKQLEEAEIICLNKIDTLAEPERKELLDAISRELPQALVLPISASTGDGLDRWRALLDGSLSPSLHIADVDYDLYAEGEAELGWLNLTLRVSSSRPFRPDDITLDIVSRMRDVLQSRHEEVAHLKALLQTPSGATVANCVGSASPVRVSQRTDSPASEGDLTLNARVHADPDDLRMIARQAIDHVLTRAGATAQSGESAHFRPGRPTPTHRFPPGKS